MILLKSGFLENKIVTRWHWWDSTVKDIQKVVGILFDNMKRESHVVQKTGLLRMTLMLNLWVIFKKMCEKKSWIVQT